MNKNVPLISQILIAGRQSLEKRGYTEVIVPRIVRATGACENVNTLFEVAVDKNFKWFDCQAYLAQTGQLYLEALVPELEKVYCTGPSFRAEGAVDNRHLTEFLMMEIEFAGNFNQLLKEIETFVSDIAKAIVKESKIKHLEISKESLDRLENCPEIFTKVTYDEAINTLQNLSEKIEWGDDISSAKEKLLLEYHGNQPLFITRYPDPMYDFGKEIEVEKFFNMLPDTENPGRVLSCDLILPFGGESVGSAARVHLADEMVARLKNSKMFKRLEKMGGNLEDFSWYIEQLKKGSVPHAGCGFGMARIIQWVMGATDIKEAVTFPSNKAVII